MEFLPERFENVSNRGTLGQPENEAAACILLDAEELQLLAELSVVALERLLL